MRTQLFKIAQAAALGFALIFTVSSCDAAVPSALVGHWLYESGSKNSEKPEKNIELFKDGTGVCDGYTISWKVENKRFVIQSSLFGIASDYKVSGPKLTLTYNDGTSATFVKKEHVEAEKAKAEAEAAKAEVAAVASFKAKGDRAKKGSFTDARDNKTYRTVKLDNQTWMSENLNFNAEGSKCYNNQDGNCQKYGRLYNWSTAKVACSSGWHLPSDAEWQVLVDFAGGDIAGKILKASSGWNDYEGKPGNGVDAFGFSALPGGSGYSNGDFDSAGNYGYWWSATEYDASGAYRRNMVYYYANVDRGYDYKTGLSSVRCVQD
jgi:uncharacterized protein (TIGR02145 family)